MTDNQKMGLRIKKLRETKGWSQAILAEKLGYSSDTAISLIEKGDRGLTIEKLRTVSNIFEVPLETLLEDGIQSEEKDFLHHLRGKLDENDLDQVKNFIKFLESQKNSD